MKKSCSSIYKIVYQILITLCLLPVLLHSGDVNTKPNIILIMADDLGYESLSCNGSQSYKTPNLDELAATGIRFDQCFSQPLCTPSRVQIMTGRYNFRNYKMFGYYSIEEVSFGNILKKAGYQTCIAGKWQLSNGVEGPHLAGFDEYCLWQIYRKIAGEWVVGSRYADPTIHLNGQLIKNTEGKYGPDIFCDFIVNFIERKKSEPFFVYYPMVLTHDPFSPSPDHPDWKVDKFANDTTYFSDMVSYMDKVVGRIVEKLDELKIRENTLILFTGDNGNHRSIYSKIGGRWVQGGKSKMISAGTHVPFIANWSGKISPNQVSDNLIDFTDFFPTLADLGGAETPEDLVIDGKSFLPLLLGEKDVHRDWVYMYYWGRGRDLLKKRESAQTAQLKLYDNGDFYDFIADPLEKKPMADHELSTEQILVKKELQDVLDNIKK